MVWIGIPRGKRRNSVGITPFKNMVLHSLKKAGNQLCNLQKLHSADVRSVVSTLNQIDIHSVGGVNCQLW